MRKSVSSPLLFIIALLLAPSAWSLTKTEQAIADRLTPVGMVCIEGDESCATAAAPVSEGPRSGEEVYGSVCMGCHNTGAAGAPKLGDVAAWAPRLEKGMETLISNAINGINAMPAKGACGNCSDEEITSAVEHLLNNSK